MSGYGYRERPDPPGRQVPAGAPQPREGVPSSMESAPVRRMVQQGATVGQVAAGVEEAKEAAAALANPRFGFLRPLPTSSTRASLSGRLETVGQRGGTLRIWVNEYASHNPNPAGIYEAQFLVPDGSGLFSFGPTTVFSRRTGGTGTLLADIPVRPGTPKTVFLEFTDSANRTTGRVSVVVGSLLNLVSELGELEAGSVFNWIQFAENLRPILFVVSLPATAEEGRRAVRKADGKEYVFRSGAWVEEPLPRDEGFFPVITAGAIRASYLNADVGEFVSVIAGEVSAETVNAQALSAVQASIGTLAELADDAGIIVAGRLQSLDATRFLDLNAAGAQPFLQHPKLVLRADGTADFTGVVTISASTSFAAGYDPSTKETPAGAQAKADASAAAAYSAVAVTMRAAAAPATRPGGGALRAGDFWINTSDGDAPWTWTGSAWQRAYTRIDGGSIVTGTIAANRLTIGAGTGFAAGYDPTTKETPAGAQAKADAAASAARLAAAKIIRQTSAPTVRPDGTALQIGDGWIDTDDGDAPYSWTGSAWSRQYTRIDGGSIVTGTIAADRLTIGNGTSFASGYDPTTKETPAGAQAKATAAETAAKAASLDKATYLTPGFTTINGGNITTGTIRASSLAIGFGGGGALNADPGFADTAAWDVNGCATVAISDGVAGLRAMRGAGYFEDRRRIPIDPAKTYRARCWARRSANSSAGHYMMVTLQDASGANINGDGAYWYYFVAGTAEGTAWAERFALFGAGTSRPFPAHARTMSIGALPNYASGVGYYEYQDLRIEEVVPGTLIRDGSITAQKIAVAQLSAISGDVGTLSAGLIRNPAGTVGMRLASSYSLGGLARYIDFDGGASDFFIFSGGLKVRNDGHVEISGSVVATAFHSTASNSTFAANVSVAGDLTASLISSVALQADGLSITDAAYIGGMLDVGTTFLRDERNISPAPGGVGGKRQKMWFSLGSALGLEPQFGVAWQLDQWADDSGGGSHQFHFSQAGNGALRHRYGTRAAGWRAWRDLAHVTWTNGPPSGDAPHGTLWFQPGVGLWVYDASVSGWVGGVF